MREVGDLDRDALSWVWYSRRGTLRAPLITSPNSQNTFVPGCHTTQAFSPPKCAHPKGHARLDPLVLSGIHCSSCIAMLILFTVPGKEKEKQNECLFAAHFVCSLRVL